MGGVCLARFCLCNGVLEPASRFELFVSAFKNPFPGNGDCGSKRPGSTPWRGDENSIFQRLRHVPAHHSGSSEAKHHPNGTPHKSEQSERTVRSRILPEQVTPEAGRDTAKRFGVSYDWKRLVSDPVYNTQMGAAEISALLKEYARSYVMTFAGYNAGRGRVRQWVAQHGDPRDPNVDEVDWVERIPISETRNYVQRVMENLQMYGVRFGASVATVEPNLHRAANVEQRPKPTSVNATPTE
jgi:soluble lytic murein transglycosylase